MTHYLSQNSATSLPNLREVSKHVRRFDFTKTTGLHVILLVFKNLNSEPSLILAKLFKCHVKMEGVSCMPNL